MTTAVLDAAKPQHVTYAVPMWLRDEQIKQNTARVRGRIQPAERREESIAVACFGPSLVETWEEIRQFKYVISCSGSHKFLLERGITPTWHVEVDPRPHKIQLLGPPHPDVEYLIASTCNPKYFEHLKGFNVKLWHVFDSKEEGIRVLPPGEWAVTGGCDVGSRAMTLAAFLGFRDLHVFGMDGCAGTVGKHAAAHPMEASKYATTVYDGVTYETTPALLEAARQIWHELDQLPTVKVKFYGTGLVQHMARHYVPKELPPIRKPFADVVGFIKPELISAEYAALNARLHEDNLAYGVGGGKHAETIIKLAETLKTRSILDYGCGKGYLAKAIPWPIWEYDPAIPGKQEAPRPADIVVCTDVLEHVEPDRLLYVLSDLARCVLKVGYLVINTGPAQKQLPDGRNTHLIQEGHNFWAKKLSKFFTLGKIIVLGAQLHIIVAPKNTRPMVLTPSPS